MELEVRHLRAVCAIADAGSVRKAARQLGMTQPSLTTQLRRIERALGGRLFVRGRDGSRPTALGSTVLFRARGIVADMATLVEEAREAVTPGGAQRLRVGSTASRAIAGWVRRLHAGLPETDTTLTIVVSPAALVQMVAAGQLDVAFVHEVTGCPLLIPEDLVQREVLAAEPQFVALSAAHPAASGDAVDVADLGEDRWMVDPSVDGEWAGLRRVFADAGINPRVVQGDYLAAADLVATGEVVTPCQPTSQARPGMAIRPLRGDPLTVRLLTVSRPDAATEAELDLVHAALGEAYREAASASPAYREWTRRRGGLPAPRSTPGRDDGPAAAHTRPSGPPEADRRTA